MSEDNPPAFIGRGFDQICFVVEDLNEAVAYWTQANGAGPWLDAMDLAIYQTEKEYRGAEGDFQFSCVYGAVGDVVIELARHDGGSSVYKDFLDEGGIGPHHIGFIQADAGEYEKAHEVYESLGIEKAMAGFFDTPDVGCRWSYWDTREQIGCYTELYYLWGTATPEMEMLRKGTPTGDLWPVRDQSP